MNRLTLLFRIKFQDLASNLQSVDIGNDAAHAFVSRLLIRSLSLKLSLSFGINIKSSYGLVDESTVAEMFASVDADGNGTITRKDFEKVMADSQNFTYTRREIEEALLLFEANDANRDGNVDILRLEKWLLLYGKSAYSEEKIKDLLYQFPVSKDGKFNRRKHCG
eukprot:CAMPEP_0184503242 /NCGR_PEP_ID=MMETSP0113_2-20130426/51776_1 /TAXON_ID=91329 /ORGANISM="Norrisiella sphaerica, Strain BC52" /LENGTH=164 /DNA_ID=CAMNT_0026892705 /DNA_START=235 /DNA_END=730 /DNA_ORIENTATION=+